MRDLLLLIASDLLINIGEWLKSFVTKAEPPVKPKPDVPPMSPYRTEIKKLWCTAIVDLSRINDISWSAAQIMTNKARYEHVGLAVGVPFYVVGVIHMRESTFNFATHLANGDPLFGSTGKPIKTTHVPIGIGPFADWESGAIAAFMRMGWHDKSYHWDLVNTLENLEMWNGPGYKNMGITSPYIWSMTNHYKRGKYSSDGVYDAQLVDQQVGCAAVLMALRSQGVDLNEV